MIDKIIDISEKPVSLKINMGRLIIEDTENNKTAVPFHEIGALIVSHPGISITASVLNGLLENKGVFICCDSKRMPSGILMNYQGNFLQAKRISMQIKATAPVKKRAWQKIITAKILSQAQSLKKNSGKDYGLEKISKNVKSGDPENIEGYAAKIYWKNIFENKNFKRNRFAPDQNAMLNYGYAILRAITARAICGTGMHPSIGIHHCNQYDAFCLADDLMEPLRTLIDTLVIEWIKEKEITKDLTREQRAFILSGFNQKIIFEEQERSIFDTISRYVYSFYQFLAGESKKIKIPVINT